MATILRSPPGAVRDAILRSLHGATAPLAIGEIVERVAADLGRVPASSVRSYLTLNTPTLFERVGLGRYRLAQKFALTVRRSPFVTRTTIGQATLYQADCFDWLGAQSPNSIHAVVTDPPYGLVEYSATEKEKLRAGKGGVWRIPPSFDGHARSPLPRFTTLRGQEIDGLRHFFERLGAALLPVLVPGANVVVATNPLLAHVVTDALASRGFEPRGSIARLVMTMRGGDRPKNAHIDYPDVSVMPRSMWEPWVVLRKPLEGRVQDNLRRWGTGGFRRPSEDKPFGDLIKSAPTSAKERRIAPHPSLKPQAFMRTLVRGSLPLGTGVVLDPFCGGGSTLAAANAVGYDSVGLELDKPFFDMAKDAIQPLAALAVQTI